MKSVYLLFLFVGVLVGCSSSGNKQSSNEAAIVNAIDSISAVAAFNADSAYAFITAQCDFGPRVPGTEAHRLAGDYLAGKLRGYGAVVTEQRMELTTFDGTGIDARNIIGEFNPSASRRILLLAHWDCRPWADNDPKVENRKRPVPGANDGASGVGVLLEVARQMSLKQPSVGIDILFVDAEDWGDSGGGEETWALGTQYWTKNPHKLGYRPMFGILLDMVGAEDARFAREYFSMQYARGIVDEVWKIAQESGYGNYFSNEYGGAVTDDHVFVNRAGIPCIDIIDQNNSTGTGFFEEWHTISDTPAVISKESLDAVGQTLLNLIYSY